MPKPIILKGRKMHTLAYELAEAVHEGQTRHDGKTPCCEHVQEVASKVQGWDLRTVAILHDTIKVTVITANELLSVGLPKPIVQAVVALTKAPDTKDYNKLAGPVKPADNHVDMRDRERQFSASGKYAEKAWKKLHDYAGPAVLLAAKKP